jgi:hypothetical protein
MAELRFSRSDIEGLIDKLSTFSSELSSSERRLLLAILSVAANHASQPERAEESDGPGDASLAELREQIVGSFVPGSGSEEFIIFSGRIGGAP